MSISGKENCKVTKILFTINTRRRMIVVMIVVMIVALLPYRPAQLGVSG